MSKLRKIRRNLNVQKIEVANLTIKLRSLSEEERKIKIQELISEKAKNYLDNVNLSK